MPCFYTPLLKKDSRTIQISDEEFHHISHVFRKKLDDEILLTSGNGLLAKSKISSLQKKELTAQILEIHPIPSSQPKIAAAFPLLKNKHDAFIVEKLTELGVKEFFPIITERTVRQPTRNTREKFEKIAISAMKQCDNAYLPRIHAAQNIFQLLQNLPEFVPIAALETDENRSLISFLQENPKLPYCFIIGPEGGFSQNEIELFRQKKISTFTLGNHILRAETAAISAAAVILGNLINCDRNYY